MKFFKLAKKFHEAEDGAVTVDWVVLTAAVVGLGVAALTLVKSGTKTQIESSISVTSVSAQLIEDFKPSSEAELLRMIPGIQVAGTSGLTRLRAGVKSTGRPVFQGWV